MATASTQTLGLKHSHYQPLTLNKPRMEPSEDSLTVTGPRLPSSSAFTEPTLLPQPEPPVPFLRAGLELFTGTQCVAAASLCLHNQVGLCLELCQKPAKPLRTLTILLKSDRFFLICCYCMIEGSEGMWWEQSSVVKKTPDPRGLMSQSSCCSFLLWNISSASWMDFWDSKELPLPPYCHSQQ